MKLRTVTALIFNSSGHISHCSQNIPGALKRFNALKSSSPSTKTSIAIGGWNEGSEKYSTVASSSAKRKKLISDAVSFLQTYGFDGFDLDWEYPGSRGGSASDKVDREKSFLKNFL